MILDFVAEVQPLLFWHSQMMTLITTTFRYKEDIDNAKKLGCNSFRLSLGQQTCNCACMAMQVRNMVLLLQNGPDSSQSKVRLMRRLSSGTTASVKTVLELVPLLQSSHSSLLPRTCRFHEIFEYLVGSGKHTRLIGRHLQSICVCVRHATMILLFQAAA